MSKFMTINNLQYEPLKNLSKNNPIPEDKA